MVGWYVRITEGTAIYQVSRVTNSTQATGTVTVTPPFTVQIGSGIDYQLHQFEPKKKFAAIDSARLAVASDVYKLVYDETITTNSYSREYTIPTSIERGPSGVYLECPFSSTANWNFLPDPAGDALSDWTASNATATSYSASNEDLYIPKYGDTCSKVQVAASVAGTLTLAVGSMENNITAAKAAGRLMTFAAWVYCNVASDLTLSILTDAGTLATSSTHQGLGWELMYVEGTVGATNATTLSVRISETSAAAVTFYVNDMWFYYGPYTQINSQYYSMIPLRISRDDSRKRFILNETVPGRRQLRVVGKAALSSLGTDLTTQNTLTMELETGSAEILYAKAAEILFEQERINTQNMPQVAQRIGFVKDRTPDVRMNWDVDVPTQRIYGPYSRGH